MLIISFWLQNVSELRLFSGKYWRMQLKTAGYAAPVLLVIDLVFFEGPESSQCVSLHYKGLIFHIFENISRGTEIIL